MKKILPGIIVLAFMSCTSSHDRLKADIASSLTAANSSFVQGKTDSVSIKKAAGSIEEFVKQFPKDSLASGYLFELALLNEKQQKYQETITVLEEIYNNYPDSKQGSKAVFLEGFLYANVLNQLDKAKEKYQLYLDKYSAVDEKVTSDVQMELQNLGKSPDEILKEIQEKTAQDSTKSS